MFVRRLARLHDLVDTPERRKRLEVATVWIAALGFLAHLALIAGNRGIASLGIDAEGLDRNFLHAVYTPFSVILFYEVLLLVLALPASHTTSVGKQYEIISLITVRRVFKDIGAFEEPAEWSADPTLAEQMLLSEEARLVLYDMGGAILMFVIVTAFSAVRRKVRHYKSSEDLKNFVNLKKALSFLLAVLFTGLAGYNVVLWGLAHTPLAEPLGLEAVELDRFFFPEFFECMIFVDVLLFIVSIRYYERYEFVFRNAAFVISTVVLRFSLSTPKPLDVGLALVAMIYGLIVLSVFSIFMSMSGKNEDLPVVGRDGPEEMPPDEGPAESRVAS